MTLDLVLALIGPGELAPIAVVLVLLFGVKKLPEIARGMGEGMKEFKKAIRDVQEDDDAPANPTVIAPAKPAATAATEDGDTRSTV